MITVFAPSGIGEVAPGDDLASAILAAVADDPAGPLAEGDVLVVTSKIISKQEGRFVPATELAAAKESETVRTVARRGSVGIVQSRLGIIQAAAGVDNSNVDPTQALVLPEDPDASAEALRAELVARTGLPLGVLISDTAGRAWRVGQTDHAIGAAGVRVLDSYAGRTDAYGNDLKVTEVAVADELAAAADLVKSKLSGRPVAVVRGLPGLVVDPAGDDDSRVRADVLLRDPAEDLFALGSREAVLAAVLHAIDRSAQFEELVALEDSTILEERVLSDLDPDLSGRELLRRVLRAAGSLPMPDGPA